ncbi:sensor histidine kinase [Paenibacillus guangzhouensis]|uniref:sensor histidine kinase n=1 Tax=Paenibacillus guangzhouensis TaxID=1473112 RepID=UPI00126736C8|nr:sensor histidine kinase [Paenibacillus guangzhouensis]
MPTNRWSQLAETISSRSRTITLSFIIFALIIQTINRSSFAIAAIETLCFVAYLVLIWSSDGWLMDYRKRAAAVILIWLLLAAAWIGFDTYKTSNILIFCLIAYNALRLPGSLSILFTAAIIVLDAAIWFFMERVSIDVIFMYSVVHGGMYGFFWGARMRRESNAIKQQHYQELRVMHTQLEQTHRALKQSHKELEEASVRSLRYAVLEERTRIARDIHDSIGHGLTSVIVQLQALPYMIKANTAEADATLSNVLDVARNCLTEVRTVVHQMAIDDAGLGLLALKSLINSVQEQSGLQITLNVKGDVTPWKADVSELLYRVLQESLTNAIRHAKATHVHVSVNEQPEKITMRIQDNGSWTGDAPPSPGFGINGMRERCECAGGSFFMRTNHPHGLALIATIPVDNCPMEGE